jgi:hypothetical protein
MITWSHTRLSDYLQCPSKFYHKHILRTTKHVESAAMRRGNEVHKALELAVNADSEGALEERKKELTVSGLEPIMPIVDRLRALGAAAELELGVRRDWTPCGFFDKDVWGRCKIDILAADKHGRGIILDWKTGATKNLKYQTDAELKLHAVIAHAHFPELKVISARYYYTQGNQFHPAKDEQPYIFTNMVAERYKINELMGRIELAVSKESCHTRKNNLCPWCEVKSCKYCIPKEKA